MLIKRRGYTLIEVIVSLVIVGIISVVIFTVFNAGLVNISKAGKRTTAVEEAVENISDIENTQPFEVDVKLPLIDNTVNVEGTEVTGSANIIGDPINKVYITTYIPIK